MRPRRESETCNGAYETPILVKMPMIYVFFVGLAGGVCLGEG